MTLQVLGMALIMLAVFYAPHLTYVAFMVMAVLSLIANYVLLMYSEKFANLPKSKKYQMLMMSVVMWIVMIFVVMHFKVFDGL